MDELTNIGFKVACSFTEEKGQTLAVVDVKGINQTFSAYGSTNLAAKNAAANLALKYINNNKIIGSQLYSDLSKIQGIENEENPNQVLKRLYPEGETHFETVCTIRVGEEEFEGRGESRGTARMIASANALESLNGMSFDMDKYTEVIKKETKDIMDIEKHPASALHEVVGQKAVFTFDEDNQSSSDWKIFKCNVRIDEKLFTGSAANKRLAKYNAALTALNGLGLSKKFKLMAPPVENIPLYNTGFKRRTERFMGASPWQGTKRGRGGGFGRGSNYEYQTPSYNDNNLEPSVYRDRGRERGRMSTRRGPRVRGRGQGMGEFSTPPFPPQEDTYGIQEPGYGPPREPYLSYSEYPGAESYNQGPAPDYSQGFEPSTSAPMRQARGGYFPQKMGVQGFGAYSNTDPMYHQYDY